MAEKIKYVRFLPFLGGVMTLFLSFIASIPFGLSFTLNFRILRSANIDFFIWGMVEEGVFWSDFHQFTLENLVPLIFWIFTLLSGINGIMCISFRSNPKTVKKLLLLSGFVLLLEFIYYTFLYFIQYGNFSFGFGYLLVGIDVVVFFLAAGLVTDYRKS